MRQTITSAKNIFSPCKYYDL